jgi:hypothetical protein
LSYYEALQVLDEGSLFDLMPLLVLKNRRLVQPTCEHPIITSSNVSVLQVVETGPLDKMQSGGQAAEHEADRRPAASVVSRIGCNQDMTVMVSESQLAAATSHEKAASVLPPSRADLQMGGAIFLFCV